MGTMQRTVRYEWKRHNPEFSKGEQTSEQGVLQGPAGYFRKAEKNVKATGYKRTWSLCLYEIGLESYKEVI